VALGAAGQRDWQGGFFRNIIYEIMPYVPPKPYQKLGQTYMRVSCRLPRLSKPLDCDGGASRDLWVAAAAQKGAAVMTAMISLDLAESCGRCAAIGDRPNGDWPNPVETPPTFDSEVLLAIANMPTWPDYVEQQGAPLHAKADAKHAALSPCATPSLAWSPHTCTQRQTANHGFGNTELLQR